MIACPTCDYENIEGADVCERCEQPLSDAYLPAPATAVERSLLKDRIRVLDPKNVVAVEPTRPVAEVLQLLVDQSIGCVVVIEDDRPAGIFSERDAVTRLNTEAAALAGHPISEFMTPTPQTLGEDAKIAFAVHRMDLGGYRHVPIVDRDGCLTGIISCRDILRYLTQQMTSAEAAGQ